MKKRRTAFIMILLASMAMFVHAVVPHHHHKDTVCISSFHSFWDYSCECQCECCGDNQEHHHTKGTDNCTARALFVTPVEDKSNDDYFFTEIVKIVFTAVVPVNDILAEQIFLYEKEVLYRPYLVIPYFSSGFSVAGLRAPPVSIA